MSELSALDLFIAVLFVLEALGDERPLRVRLFCLNGRCRFIGGRQGGVIVLGSRTQRATVDDRSTSDGGRVRRCDWAWLAERTAAAGRNLRRRWSRRRP